MYIVTNLNSLELLR